MAMPMEEERPVTPPPPMNPEPPMDQPAPAPAPEGMDQPDPNAPADPNRLRQELGQVIKNPQDLDRAANLMETDSDVRTFLRMLSENPNVKEFMMILGRAGQGQTMGQEPPMGEAPPAPPTGMEDRLAEARGDMPMARPPMSGV